MRKINLLLTAKKPEVLGIVNGECSRYPLYVMINGMSRLFRSPHRSSPGSQGGFTLVELVVVIAVIAVLSNIAIVQLGKSLSKARDGRRKGDLAALASAMHLNYADNGTFTLLGAGYEGGGQGWVAATSADQSNYVAVSLSGLLNQRGYLNRTTVEDPIQRPGFMLYVCGNGGADIFSISATLENPTEDDKAHILTTCNGSGSNGTGTVYGKNFAVP